ncbi:MAG: UbiA family prenyltransferase [Armatimonadetes bacterium]|nr:UbiA family prenyltransferase [Armatimonadota bacterium]
MLSRLRTYLEMIKFHHTVFALPFALTSALVADRGLPEASKLGWILLAMFGARSAAMGFNRIVDRHIDARNPRTAGRELPAGKISLTSAVTLTGLCAVLFVFAANRLNALSFHLSFPALFVLCFYSYTKRFTSLSHFFLGLALGIAPLGAWVAVTGELAWEPALLGVAVMLWVSGFDIIYACLDAEFDKQAGLHSMVQRLGIEGGLRLARLLHFGFVTALGAFGVLAQLTAPFFLGVFAIAALLIYEHSLVRPDDLKRVNMAFFTVNGVISVLLLVATGVDIWLLPT